MTRASTRPRHRRLAGIVILHEDADLLVIDKPAGLLTVSSDTQRERTAYWILTDYVRKGCAKSRHRVFIVHRLDRETSGLLVFAKRIEVKERLQQNWESVEKRYLALVHGLFAEPEGTVDAPLSENRAHVVYVDPARGRPARTAYHVLAASGGMSLLQVRLLTGRKNQIRVHLASIGHPVAGDLKYGRVDRFRRMALHAHMLSFSHPVSGRRMRFEAPVPSDACFELARTSP